MSKLLQVFYPVSYSHCTLLQSPCNRKKQRKLDLVQLCETQMFKFVLYRNIIFDILEQSSFQKYTTFWVFLALCHMRYLYICVFVFLYLCVLHMGI